MSSPEKSYDHRRELIRNRLEFLAGVMGIEVLGYAIMSNHCHTIVMRFCTEPEDLAQRASAAVLLS